MIKNLLFLIFILNLNKLEEITEVGISSINNVVKDNEFSLVFYYANEECPHCGDYEKEFLKLKTDFPNMKFYKVLGNHFYNEKLYIYEYPTVDLFINDYNIRYSDSFEYEKLKVWLSDVMNSKLTTEEKFTDDEIINFNLILYYKGEPTERILNIAKAMNPMKIYNNIEYLDKLFPEDMKENELYGFRQYDEKISQIDINESMKTILYKIQTFEFPITSYFNYSTFKWIFQLNMTSMIFFTKDLNHTFIKNLSFICKSHINNFQLIILEDNNEYSKMMKEFLGVKESPALRIFNTNGKIKKYSYYEAFEEIELNSYINQYNQNKIKPMKVNEVIDDKIEKDKTFKSINRRNYKKLLKLDLFYVLVFYSNLYDNTELFKVLDNISKRHLKVKFMKIDVVKNDVENIHYDLTPVILVSNKYSFLHYKSKEKDVLKEDELENFIKEKIDEGIKKDEENEKKRKEHEENEAKKKLANEEESRKEIEL